MDAISLLKEDHRAVEKLFRKLARSRGSRNKVKLCAELMRDLLVHTRIEEAILYPQVKKERSLRTLAEESFREHAEVNERLQALAELDPSDDAFDELLTEIEELVDEHIHDEEQEMFPSLEERWDAERLEQIGEQLATRKEEELQQITAQASETTAGPGRPPKARGRKTAPAQTGASGGGGAGRYRATERSKRELYERAQQLDIPGRSRMSKEELAKAVEKRR